MYKVDAKKYIINRTNGVYLIANAIRTRARTPTETVQCVETGTIFTKKKKTISPIRLTFVVFHRVFDDVVFDLFDRISLTLFRCVLHSHTLRLESLANMFVILQTSAHVASTHRRFGVTCVCGFNELFFILNLISEESEKKYGRWRYANRKKSRWRLNFRNGSLIIFLLHHLLFLEETNKKGFLEYMYTTRVYYCLIVRSFRSGLYSGGGFFSRIWLVLIPFAQFNQAEWDTVRKSCFERTKICHFIHLLSQIHSYKQTNHFCFGFAYRLAIWNGSRRHTHTHMVATIFVIKITICV